jgi:hypothetical protein
MIGERLGEDQRVGEISMHPEQDDLAAATEYICVRLHPQELRSRYVANVRGGYQAGDVTPEFLITLLLQALDTGMTDLFIALLGAYLYDKFKQPDPNVQRLLQEQRSTLARLETAIGHLGSDEKQPEAARVMHQEQTKTARVSQQLHESTIQKIEASDPEIPAMVEDALHQLEALGANALVDEVHAADDHPWPPVKDAPIQRTRHRIDFDKLDTD